MRTQKMTPESYHKNMDKYLDIDTSDKIQKIFTMILYKSHIPLFFLCHPLIWKLFFELVLRDK